MAAGANAVLGMGGAGDFLAPYGRLYQDEVSDRVRAAHDARKRR
ncbi:hypothetical protein [Phenylobacterium sp.]